MNIKKIRPMFTSILVTKDVYTDDVKEGGLITKANGTVKEDQTVIAVGESSRGIKVGDLVHIDPSRYAVRKYQEDSVKSDLMTNQIIGYNIPQITMDGRNYLLIDVSDVKYVIEEYEDDTPEGLITKSRDIIMS